MIFSSTIAACLAGVVSGFSSTEPISAFLTPAPAEIVSSAYIVELQYDDSPSDHLSKSDTTVHPSFHRRAATGLDYSVRQEFTNPSLFYGLSIQVQENSTAEEIHGKLMSIAGVKSVWPVMEVFLDSPAAPAPNQPPMRGKKRCVPRPTTSVTTPTATSSSINTLIPPKVTGSPDVSSSLRMSDVEKLHALGIKGKGMKIGIIDTGVDYRHPALGAGFGPNKKIAGGYAFVDDNGKGVSIPDPLVTCPEGGHGTHCSGIVGMQDPDNVGFGLVGVAPEAEIYMYRVFGCSGGAATDNILAAMNRAHSDGVDVISLSLGLQAQTALSDPFQTMTSALTAEGIAVIAATGNDGAQGPFHASAPGVGRDVIAVGCIENTVFPTVYQAADSEGRSFSYASVWPLTSPSTGFSVYILETNGCEESEWIAASEVVTDKSHCIIVFQGDKVCTVLDKAPLWTKYGFSKIMGYPGPSTDPYTDQYVVADQLDNFTQYSYVLRQDGQSIATAYASAGGYPNYQMLFSNNTVSSTPMKTAGMISYFTSYGPTWDTLELKPQLSAPGASILATWPLGFNSGYAAIRGTSMATPFVAACYALVKSQFPSLSVWEIRELLQSTSSPVFTAYEPDRLATVVQQGAGLVNPYKAITYRSTVTPTQFEIGDSDDYVGVNFNFTITNNSPEPQTYTVSHRGAGLTENYNSFYYFNISTTDGLPAAIYGAATFSDTDITINSGQSSTVYFSISPPSDVEAGLVPVISGFIVVRSSSGETFNLPYEGLAYSRYHADQLVRQIVPLDGTIYGEYPLFTYYDPVELTVELYNGSGIMEVDKAVAIEDSGWFGVWYATFQSNLADRVDVLPANTTFVPTHYGYDTSVQWSYIASAEPFLGLWVDGQTQTYALVQSTADQHPTTIIPFWQGFKAVSVGDYRLLISILKWGGTADNLEDWETWLSPILRIVDSSARG